MKQEQVPAGNQSNLQEAAQRERDQLKWELFTALGKIEQLEQELAERQALLGHIYASSSWRLTAPLRAVATSAAYLVRPRKLLAALASRGAVVATRYPRTRTTILAGLDRFPSVKEALRRVVMPSLVADWSAPDVDYAEQMTLEKLPPSARFIYSELVDQLPDKSSP